MGRGFRWNEWNVNHIAEHAVSPEEAEEVVLAVSPPYPSYEGNGKWLVRGQTEAGRFLQVIYLVDKQRLYVIHARSLTDAEKRRLRRRRR